MPSWISDPAAAIRARAAAEGFDTVRIVRAHLPPLHRDRLDAFLAAGHFGTMEWLARNAEKRAEPTQLWPEARSIVVVGVNYAPQDRDFVAPISAYARGDDYHDVIKKKLKNLAGYIAETFAAEVKVFVDTAPVLEKALAEGAGMGWQGKHTNLVSRDFGSWLFLGTIFTTLSLPADPPVTGSCGACHACLDVCPTQAFVAPYRMDARRCISYLTIEHKGPIPRALRPGIGTRIYGCDACLAACPWNKFATPTKHAEFQPRAAVSAMDLTAFAGLDDAAFRTTFAKSPIKRIGRERFVRNVLIAIGNMGTPTHIPVAMGLLTDASPQVRGAAVWALSQLLPPADFAALADAHVQGEPDEDVRAEWRGRA